MAYNRQANLSDIQNGEEDVIVNPSILKQSVFMLSGNTVAGIPQIGTNNAFNVSFIVNGIEELLLSSSSLDLKSNKITNLANATIDSDAINLGQLNSILDTYIFSSGETNTASNVNVGGIGIFKQKTGVNLEFKGVNAISNKISITDDTINNEIDIDVNELYFTNIPQSGVTNLISDLSDKQNTLVSGTNIKTINGDTLLGSGNLLISADGETNTASNVNVGGIGIFKQKTGVNLEFKGVNAISNKISITDDTINNEINIDVNELYFTNIPQSGVTNLISDLSDKQNTLISGTNIKTINGDTLLGSGNLLISGGGLTKSINNIAVNTTAGNTIGTIYYYYCTGTLTLTLPTAISNTNIYVVKNVGTGIITIDTTSSQTIDGSLTAIIYFKNSSLDINSDNSNWLIS